MPERELNPAEWNRVTELFASAVELDTGGQSVFLGSECGSQPTLLREVERLLGFHRRNGGVLDRPLFAPSCQTQEDEWSGRVLASRYVIERLIARGGMASVYLAHDEQLSGRRVIVKFLHAWARQYTWLKSKFRLEMEALARIDHHAVVGVLDAGETADGLPFLVIEYIDGVTLRSEMQKGAMDIARIARIVREAAKAVAAAHARGVLHRDLKPENIMLEAPGTGDERVRLIDFGIARLDGLEPGLATQVTQFAGTTAYMAPEQLRGKPTRASDIYAIGVVAYEMLAGIRPFPAASPVELHDQQRAGAKAEPLRRRHEIPLHAVRLILKQLSFRPESRSASALEAGEEIAAALLGPPGVRWSRRQMAAALMSGAAGIGTGGYILSTRSSDALAFGERVIELPPAVEPLEHGFQKENAIEYRVLSNLDATGLDSIRVTSPEQGMYYHPLNRAQSLAASRRGWKLLLEAKVEEGALFGNIDYQHARHRHAVNLYHDPRGFDVARLITSVSPVFRGLDWPIPGPPGARHQLVMIQGPQSETTELWVDGVKRLSGAPGLDDFRYRRGVEFGVRRLQSLQGSAVVWQFRLEIG
jgi:serine/threonine-protein kinase